MRGRTRFHTLFRTLALLICFVPSSHATAQDATAATADLRLAAGRFTVVATPRDARLAQTLLSAAVAQDTFPGLPRPQAAVLVSIAANARQFREWAGAGAPEWGAAVAIPSERRIVMQGSRAGSDAGDPPRVLRHELAHLALHEHMGTMPPRWFDEGYASYAAGEWNRESAFETSVGLIWQTLPSRDTLEAGFSAGASRAEWSYALAQRIVVEMAALDPRNGLRNFFADWKASGSMETGLRQAFGMTGVAFDRHWQAKTRQRYGALGLVTNLSMVGGLFGVLLGPVFWSRRRRDRRKLEAMRAAEAAQERVLRESALEALLAEPL